jgi:hypothetical protein
MDILVDESIMKLADEELQNKIQEVRLENHIDHAMRELAKEKLAIAKRKTQLEKMKIEMAKLEKFAALNRIEEGMRIAENKDEEDEDIDLKKIEDEKEALLREKEAILRVKEVYWAIYTYNGHSEHFC